MNKFLAVALYVFSALFVTAEGFAAEKVSLVFVSRMTDIQNPETAAELGRLATFLKKVRSEQGHVLFVHGGNALGPSALSSFDSGAHMVGLLNWLEPYAMTVGRGEFFLKEDVLSMRAHDAIFPFVCANVVDPLTQGPPEGLERTEVYTLDGKSIGLTGIASPELESSYRPVRAKVVGSLDVLGAQVKDFKSKGVACSIAVTDYLKGDLVAGLEQTGADIFVFTDGDKFFSVTENGRLAIEMSAKKNVVLVELILEDNNSLGYTVASVSAIDLFMYEPDVDFAQEVALYTSSLDSLLNAPLGTVEKPFDTLRNNVRSQENAFANFVADTLRDYYHADIALMNSGGIRGNRRYEAGAVFTRRDLQSELPLHDATVLLSLTGRQVLEALEHGVSQVENLRGRFLHVSGCRYVYDYTLVPGTRVTSVTVGSEPLDLGKVYSVATVSYLADGGDAFTMLKNAPKVDTLIRPQDIGELLRLRIPQEAAFGPVLEKRIIRQQVE